jgi:hypothetical protein
MSQSTHLVTSPQPRFCRSYTRTVPHLPRPSLNTRSRSPTPPSSANTSLSQLYKTAKINPLANLTLQVNISNLSSLRETYWAVTFKLHRDFAAFTKTCSSQKSCQLLVLPPVLRNFAKRGGNAPGLSEEDVQLLLLSTATHDVGR